MLKFSKKKAFADVPKREECIARLGDDFDRLGSLSANPEVGARAFLRRSIIICLL